MVNWNKWNEFEHQMIKLLWGFFHCNVDWPCSWPMLLRHQSFPASLFHKKHSNPSTIINPPLIFFETQQRCQTPKKFRRLVRKGLQTKNPPTLAVWGQHVSKKKKTPWQWQVSPLPVHPGFLKVFFVSCKKQLGSLHTSPAFSRASAALFWMASFVDKAAPGDWEKNQPWAPGWHAKPGFWNPQPFAFP